MRPTTPPETEGSIFCNCTQPIDIFVPPGTEKMYKIYPWYNYCIIDKSIIMMIEEEEP